MLTNDEVTRKTALLLLSRGSGLPAYLATLNIADRLVCVKAIDSVNRLPQDLFLSLVAWPDRVANGMTKKVRETFDEMAVKAQEVISSWSFHELVADINKLASTKAKWNKLSETGNQKAGLN